jgi:hypothetical protein
MRGPAPALSGCNLPAGEVTLPLPARTRGTSYSILLWLRPADIGTPSPLLVRCGGAAPRRRRPRAPHRWPPPSALAEVFPAKRHIEQTV